MTSNKLNKTVLLVDDDPTVITVNRAKLEKLGYTIVDSDNGMKALEYLDLHYSELSAIISDVEMPKMDGYTFCQAVRDKWCEDRIPFIFASSSNSLEDMVEGFEAGGDDYVGKPLLAEVFQIKLNNLLEKQKLQSGLSDQLKESRDVAFQAMTYTSNLGQVLQFLQSSLKVKNFTELGKLVIEVTHSFNLNCVIQFRTADKIFNISNNQKVTSIEVNVMEMTYKKGRMFDFGCRTVINYDDFSLLIKNMPSDPAAVGNVKDTINNLCNAIQVRVKLLLSDDVSAKKDELIKTVNNSMSGIDSSLKHMQHDNLSAAEQMMDALDHAMLTLGLTEEQEDTLRGITNLFVSKSEEIFAKGKEIHKELNHIIECVNPASKVA